MNRVDRFKKEVQVGDIVLMSTSNSLDFGVITKSTATSTTVSVVEKTWQVWDNNLRRYVEQETIYYFKGRACHYPSIRMLILSEPMQYGFPDQELMARLQQASLIVKSGKKIPKELK